jgi:DNA-binding HxlR family transcriptional regulator
MVTKHKYTIKDWSDSDCQLVESIFEKLSGKYTLLIVSILVLEGEHSFGDLRRAVPAINTKTLADRLAYLTRTGVISNRRVTEGRVNKSYYFVNSGNKEFQFLLKAFREYGHSNFIGKV